MKQQRNLLDFKVICSQLSIVNLQVDSLILCASPEDLKKKKKKRNICLYLFICSLILLHILIVCQFYSVIQEDVFNF